MSPITVDSSNNACYSMRLLQLGDLDNGYLECLSQLTTLGDCSREHLSETVKFFHQHQETYRPYVLVDSETSRVVGCGTLLIEQKIIHGCKSVGHIEEIVVHNSKRGLKLGSLILKHLIKEAKGSNCYKVILNCQEKVKDFYEKNGFCQKDVEMCIYF